MRVLTVLVIILLCIPQVAFADSAESQQYTSPRGNEFIVSFDESSETVEVRVTNTNNRERDGSFRVTIDRWYWRFEEFSLPAGASKSFKFDLTDGFDVTRDKHAVKFSAGPEPLWFNYTKDVDPSTTEEYPTPEITDVSLERGTYRGENRTFINVSARNPSGRNRNLVIRAHTLETTGYYHSIYMPAYGNGSSSIILKEKPGELVAGEVRMYDGNFSSMDGAFDQVEIYGRSTGDTSWSHEEYETVTAPWEPDPYVYENRSAYREKVSPDTAAESPVVWGLVGLAIAVLVSFVWRR